MRRLLSSVTVSSVVASLVLAAASLPSVRADEEPIPRLEKHPHADAKPGEWRRIKVTAQGEEKFLVERVLAVKPDGSKVFYDVVETSEDGKESKGVVQKGAWKDVPKFEPTTGQEFKKDEMVWFEVAGKKIAARHFRIVEQVNPPYPAPVKTRDVWFSNEVLGSGKVQELQDSPPLVLTALAWGTLSDEELAKARKDYGIEDAPAEKPPEKPATPAPAPPAPAPKDGGADSCGGAGGCGK